MHEKLLCQGLIARLGKQAIECDNNHTGADSLAWRVSAQDAALADVNSLALHAWLKRCWVLDSHVLAAWRAEPNHRAGMQVGHVARFGEEVFCCAQARCWRRCWAGRRPRLHPSWRLTPRPAPPQ